MEQIGTLVATRQPNSPVEVTPESIAQVQKTLELLQKSIPGVLTPNIDYGHIPGVKGMSLFDSGAQSIINFFNSYAGQRSILHFRDDGEMVAICVEVQVVNRGSGLVIATGVGASSTEESKNKYRWVDNPLDWGYSQEALDNWPKREIKPDEKSGKLQYRIKNPEHAELLNNILTMASKRAEVDAAKSLPGVGTALRLLFDGKLRPGPEAGAGASRNRPIDSIPDWNRFWGEVNKLGLKQDQVYTKLGVTAIHEWLKQGKTLDDALAILRAGTAPGKADKPTPAKTDKKYPTEVPDMGTLWKVCFELWGMQPADVVKELGYVAPKEISETPWDCYITIKRIKEG
jgi:hypothetical protein